MISIPKLIAYSKSSHMSKIQIMFVIFLEYQVCRIHVIIKYETVA